MSNYFIIGGDGKQYGPITADDLRKWVSEGRLNAQSQAMAEGEMAWRTLGTFPEFADLFQSAGTTSSAQSFVQAADWLERDYDLDIGGCVSRAWKLTTGNFGKLFVPVLIYFLIEFVIGLFASIPFVGPLFSFANLFISAPLLAGTLYIFILTLRGQPAELEKMFDGFRHSFWQLFFGYFIPMIFYAICMSPFLFIYFTKLFPMLKQMQNASQADIQSNISNLESAMFSSLPVLLVCAIPLMYLTVNWQFVLPLILDKRMKFWPAMKASWKKVHQHWWTVFGLLVVIGLMNIVGVLLCCVGLIFTIPLGFATLMCAYETIFGESKAN